ncbi:alpha/beta hydrolase [Rhodovulum adriaticum]|uniref:Acetyl esterase/lipase n=1 Tax=Rhodovulum adriaticum TaxID=35804 RepID=A0A4R2NXK6_RHOAD|nr:hypothetical protein [Rhodovulum adriaticum]MBK1636320.1 hypothetical protein [Rhodovulum adriaticum]TCP26321.1 acetyl esterase/lipase [Rhodovulum adriaticum]
MAVRSPPDHYIRHDDLEYGRAICRGAEVALTLDLSLPKAVAGPVPLVMWMHPGGFHGGDKGWAGHRTDARWLTKAGYAYAVINYRLRAVADDLSPPVARRMGALQRHRDPAFRKNLSGAAALAALEDALTALNWLAGQRERFNLSDWVALGGNSAGAITAFNVVHLAGFFGLPRPAIRALVSISGGFAYPGLYAPALVPVHALHSPADPRVDIAAIRQVARIGGAAVELIESEAQQHGRVRLSPDEPARDAYRRIIGFLDRVRAKDP